MMTKRDSSSGVCLTYAVLVDDEPSAACRVCEQPESAHVTQGTLAFGTPFSVVCSEVDLVELRGKWALVEIAQDVLRQGGAA